VVLYVETLIAAPLADVWRLTRDPAQHARWDVRFSRIEPYGADGRFRYTTRVLPGLTVVGFGVTAGERRRPDGCATSALRFACTHPLSLIRSGAGYWRYVPTPRGVRFLTGYDYVPGWGRLGAVADRAFRPLFGWATAWSFDRLRLWLERGISPERSRNQALAEAAMRLAVAVGGFTAGYPIAALALLLPPLPGTPAARRCRRRFWGAPDASTR
jgi:Polyketide cyclase / dehydrase and lipid transport